MSREAELYKDKIEVSLDGRQIFYLFFGGSVIVGLVFVLGVMVGRRVEARGHVDRARVAATVDPLAALDRLEGGTNLSFQGALRGVDAPASDVEKQIAAMQKADVKADAKKAVEPKAAERVEEKKVEEKKVEEKKVEEKKVEEKKAEKKTESTKTEKQVEEPKGGEKKTAAEGESSDEPVEDKKPRYTLQLSSFQDKNEAEVYLASVKSAGYQAHMTQGTVDGKQYYRVRMGAYRSADAANEAKAEFEKSSRKTALVTRL